MFALLTGFLGGLPWKQIIIGAAIIAAIVYGIHIIKQDGMLSDQLKQTQQQAINDKAADDVRIKQMAADYANNIAALTQQKNDVLKIVTETQRQLEVIKNVKPDQDGPTRGVIITTMRGLRDQRTNAGAADPKGNAAAGTAQ